MGIKISYKTNHFQNSFTFAEVKAEAGSRMNEELKKSWL